MSLFETFELDKKAEIEGVLFNDLPINDDGSVPGFYISRQCALNKKWATLYEKLTKPYSKAGKLEDLDEDVAAGLNRVIFCESLLCGWENVFDREGKPIEFSIGTALKLFSELPELLHLLHGFSTDMVNYRVSQLEKDAKK